MLEVSIFAKEGHSVLGLVVSVCLSTMIKAILFKQSCTRYLRQ